MSKPQEKPKTGWFKRTVAGAATTAVLAGVGFGIHVCRVNNELASSRAAVSYLQHTHDLIEGGLRQHFTALDRTDPAATKEKQWCVKPYTIGLLDQPGEHTVSAASEGAILGNFQTVAKCNTLPEAQQRTPPPLDARTAYASVESANDTLMGAASNLLGQSHRPNITVKNVQPPQFDR